jgi:hypothetical protein
MAALELTNRLVQAIQVNNVTALFTVHLPKEEEWGSILHFGVSVFSKCIICCFAFLIGHVVQLLAIHTICSKVKLTVQSHKLFFL